MIEIEFDIESRLEPIRNMFKTRTIFVRSATDEPIETNTKPLPRTSKGLFSKKRIKNRRP